MATAKSAAAKKANNEAYRLRKQSAWVYGEPKPKLAVVYELEQGICYLCGESTSELGASMRDLNRPTVDHIVPLSKGGKNTYANSHLAHFRCNRQKSNKLDD